MQALRPEILVQVERNLAVRARTQAVPAALKLLLNCLETVELAVDDYLTAAIFASDRLSASCEVDDAESRMAESHASISRGPVTLPIGTAMEDCAWLALVFPRQAAHFAKRFPHSTQLPLQIGPSPYLG